MDNWLSALIGGASSLIGGFMNKSSQQAINSQTIAQQNFMAGGGNLPSLVESAKKVGLSPLAVLGQSGGMSPSLGSINPGDAISKAGQDLSRAFVAGSDTQDKNAELQRQLTQSQIDRTNAETTGQMLQNSRLARTFASPGTPPGLVTKPDGTQAHPFPSAAYFRDPDTGVVTKGMSEEMAHTQFGPTAWLTGTEQIPFILGGQIKDAVKAGYNFATRPDVVRSLSQGNYSTP